ncbi:MAG TPA: aspartate/glutamate racemase family protein [Stellaceae bacterium]|nr:aspartate/glutamate racemase family protein [Stellaceae bacterium]
MTRILLINPNSSEATTAQMTTIARAVAPPGVEIVCATARRAPPMILTTAELAAAEREVVAMGLDGARDADGIIIGAFGDPGLAALHARVGIPVVGIAEAAMLEAAAGGRRFGVATTTPALVDYIAVRAREMGVGDLYTGIRLTEGEPIELVADPPRLVEALAAAVRLAIENDGAEAVAIGGGPLGNAAAVLAGRFATPIIAPIPAAMHRLLQEMQRAK